MRERGSGAAQACIAACGPPFITKDKVKMNSQELREQGVFAGGRLEEIKSIGFLMFGEGSE